MLLVALATIYRPVSIGLKRNLGLLAAIRTNCIVHLSWASVEATTSFSIHACSRTLSGKDNKFQWYISVWIEPLAAWQNCCDFALSLNLFGINFQGLMPFASCPFTIDIGHDDWP